MQDTTASQAIPGGGSRLATIGVYVPALLAWGEAAPGVPVRVCGSPYAYLALLNTGRKSMARSIFASFEYSDALRVQQVLKMGSHARYICM
jgi:hypothetical protein